MSTTPAPAAIPAKTENSATLAIHRALLASTLRASSPRLEVTPAHTVARASSPTSLPTAARSARSESTALGGRMSAPYALLERTTRLLPQDVLLAYQEPSQLAMLVLSARRESMQNLLLLLALPAQERENTRQRKDRQHAPLLPLDTNLPPTTPPSRLAPRTHSQSEPATIVHPVLTAVIPCPAPPPAKSARLERTTTNQPTLVSPALVESSLRQERTTSTTARTVTPDSSATTPTVPVSVPPARQATTQT